MAVLCFFTACSVNRAENAWGERMNNGNPSTRYHTLNWKGGDRGWEEYSSLPSHGAAKSVPTVRISYSWSHPSWSCSSSALRLSEGLRTFLLNPCQCCSNLMLEKLSCVKSKHPRMLFVSVLAFAQRDGEGRESLSLTVRMVFPGPVSLYLLIYPCFGYIRFLQKGILKHYLVQALLCFLWHRWKKLLSPSLPTPKKNQI